MSIGSLKRYLTPWNGESQMNQKSADNQSSNGLERQARHLAEQYCSGFQLHDRRQHQDAIDAFYTVDQYQFVHLSDEDAYKAAEAYVDALWAKDEIEKRCTRNGEIDQAAIRDADYEPVQELLALRADVVGMNQEYADETTTAWRRHKTNDDYWTPFLKAQTIELRVALQNPDYPEKPRGGRSGAGPLATRYNVGVELHDLHSSSAWEEAINVMTPYYQQILSTHQND